MKTSTDTAAGKAYRVLGTTTDVTECDLCGRTELRGTIILLPLDVDGNAAGDAVHYGSECGARAAGWTAKQMTTNVRTAASIALAAERKAKQADADAAQSAWERWIFAQTGKDLAAGMQALGGYAAARAAYRTATA
jgi:hypothetical protein